MLWTDSRDDLFTDYVLDMYKNKSLTTGPERSLYKSLLNNLIGRFGLTLNDKTTMLLTKEDYNLISLGHKITNVHILHDSYLTEIERKVDIGLLESNNVLKNIYLNNPVYKNIIKLLNTSSYSSNTSIIIPLIINARARLYLFKLIHQLQNSNINVYYCDTDSIVVDSPLPYIFVCIYIGPPPPPNFVSGAGGQFKLEHTVSKGYFISGKLYKLFNIDGSIKTVNKGIGSKLSTMDFINLYKGKSISGASIKSMKDWKDGSVSINPVEITLTGNYNKRIKIYDNKGYWIDTKPIVYTLNKELE